MKSCRSYDTTTTSNRSRSTTNNTSSAASSYSSNSNSTGYIPISSGRMNFYKQEMSRIKK